MLWFVFSWVCQAQVRPSMAIASRIQKRVLASFAAAAAAKLPEAAVAAAGGAAEAVEEVASSVQEQVQAQGAQVLEFGDTERLFAGERSTSLVRTLAVLQALSVGPLVDVATAALRSPAVAGSAAGRAAARATAYQHFCAGETAEEAAAAVRRLWRGGMGGILDYGIEDAEDGPACDRNAAGFLAAIDVAAALPPGSVSRRRRRLTLAGVSLSSLSACVAVGPGGCHVGRNLARADPRIPWESSGSKLPVNRTDATASWALKTSHMIPTCSLRRSFPFHPLSHQNPPNTIN